MGRRDLHNKANGKYSTPEGNRNTAADAIGDWCRNKSARQRSDGELESVNASSSDVS
jgi:hypothetical protein